MSGLREKDTSNVVVQCRQCSAISSSSCFLSEVHEKDILNLVLSESPEILKEILKEILWTINCLFLFFQHYNCIFFDYFS